MTITNRVKWGKSMFLIKLFFFLCVLYWLVSDWILRPSWGHWSQSMEKLWVNTSLQCGSTWDHFWAQVTLCIRGVTQCHYLCHYLHCLFSAPNVQISIYILKWTFLWTLRRCFIYLLKHFLKMGCMTKMWLCIKKCWHILFSFLTLATSPKFIISLNKMSWIVLLPLLVSV